VHAHLGVYRAVSEAQRTHSGLGGGLNAILSLLRLARGRHINRLFEEGAFERIRFVKNRERCHLARSDQSLESKLAARNIVFDEHRSAGIEHRGDALTRGEEFMTIIGANDASARRRIERLKHTRKLDVLASFGACKNSAEGRNRQARGLESLADDVLIGG